MKEKLGGNENIQLSQQEKFNGSFLGKDIVSVEQFTSREELEKIFEISRIMREAIEKRSVPRILEGYCACLLFYQPSSRTFSSFSAAAKHLGANVVEIPGMTAYSSAVKGESLSDTIRTFKQTTAADLIVLRHPEDSSSFEAARFSDVPIINAGSGRLEHPTQAVLDIYTIKEELGRIDDMTITFAGDLRNGRTVKSLALLLGMAGENIKMNFVSPEALKLPEGFRQRLEKRGVVVQEGNNEELQEAISSSDVLYVTRVQSEWFAKQALEDARKSLGDKARGISDESLAIFAKELGVAEYKKAVEGYVINKNLIGKSNALVMHPLPRVDEIATDVDDMPNAIYFQQMRYGLESRMALLALVLGRI